jgi:sulfatase modifying factor 1
MERLPGEAMGRVNTNTKVAVTLSALLGLVLAASPAWAGEGTDEDSSARGPVDELEDCPRDMALVGHTCVDKYEASLVERLEDGREVDYSPYETPKHHPVRAVSRPGVFPQAHISMVEAQRACKASGKRLCHAKEWKAACRGPARTRYPYGEKRMSNVCVDTHRTSPIGKLHNGEHTDRTLNDPRLNQMEGTVEPTGHATACTNGYGVHDMVGNVHEWVDDGTFRGGYYLDTEINGEGCEYITNAHARTYYDYSTGFRCCADAGSLPADEDIDVREAESPLSLRTETRVPATKVAEADLEEGDSIPFWDLAPASSPAILPKKQRRRV